MAKDLNKVMLTGHLGADPEMRYTAQGSAVTTFRVASGRAWKSSDGMQHDDTEWFRVVAWDKLGEICNQYLTKGSRVYVEGRLQTRKWQDKNGQDRYTTEIIANEMKMLGGRASGSAPFPAEGPETDSAPASRAPQGPAPARPPVSEPPQSRPDNGGFDDDIPFLEFGRGLSGPLRFRDD